MKLPPFILIALPGTGKSTCLSDLKQILSTNNTTYEIKETDAIIRSRISLDDKIVKCFLTKNPEIDTSLFKKVGSISGEFISKYGEEKWRDLESMFVKDILESINQNIEILDMGGKAPLHNFTNELLTKKGFTKIFLYSEPRIIIDRLEANNNWQNRGNYKTEGKDGWRKLANCHRKERMPLMINNADIIIEVSRLDPAQTAKEILYRLKEYNLQKQR